MIQKIKKMWREMIRSTGNGNTAAARSSELPITEAEIEGMMKATGFSHDNVLDILEQSMRDISTGISIPGKMSGTDFNNMLDTYEVQGVPPPEDLGYVLYDRVLYQPKYHGDTIPFFTIPMGQDYDCIDEWGQVIRRVKTKADTNMSNAGVIPTKMIRCHGVALGFSERISDGLWNWLNSHAVLRARVIDKEVSVIPCQLIPKIQPFEKSPSCYMIPIPFTIPPYANFSIDLLLQCQLDDIGPFEVSNYWVGMVRRPG